MESGQEPSVGQPGTFAEERSKRGRGEVIRLRPTPEVDGDDAVEDSAASIGAAAAILAGILGLLYSISFVIVARTSPELGGLLSALLLLLGGLLSSAVVAALYLRLAPIDRFLALWATALGLAGAVGAMVHGGYDLANALHPPATPNVDLPNPIDPRGLLTFGAAGLAVLAFAWLIRRDERWPGWLAYLGYALGILLVIVYLGRLVVLDAASPLVLVPAALVGFVVNPAWYVAVGATLRRATVSTARGRRQ